MDLLKQAKAHAAADMVDPYQHRMQQREEYFDLLRRHDSPEPGDAKRLASMMTQLSKSEADVRRDIERLAQADAFKDDAAEAVGELAELEPIPELRARLEQLDAELAQQIRELLKPKVELLARIDRHEELKSRRFNSMSRAERLLDAAFPMLDG